VEAALKLAKLSKRDTEDLTREPWKEIKTSQLKKQKMPKWQKPGTPRLQKL